MLHFAQRDETEQEIQLSCHAKILGAIPPSFRTSLQPHLCVSCPLFTLELVVDDPLLRSWHGNCYRVHHVHYVYIERIFALADCYFQLWCEPQEKRHGTVKKALLLLMRIYHILLDFSGHASFRQNSRIIGIERAYSKVLSVIFFLVSASVSMLTAWKHLQIWTVFTHSKMFISVTNCVHLHRNLRSQCLERKVICSSYGCLLSSHLRSLKTLSLDSSFVPVFNQWSWGHCLQSYQRAKDISLQHIRAIH